MPEKTKITSYLHGRASAAAEAPIYLYVEWDKAPPEYIRSTAGT